MLVWLWRFAIIKQYTTLSDCHVTTDTRQVTVTSVDDDAKQTAGNRKWCIYNAYESGTVEWKQTSKICKSDILSDKLLVMAKLIDQIYTQITGWM